MYHLSETRMMTSARTRMGMRTLDGDASKGTTIRKRDKENLHLKLPLKIHNIIPFCLASSAGNSNWYFWQQIRIC